MLSMWNEMSGKNRAGLVVGVAVIAVFLVVAIIWLMQERYAVLFADMQMNDAAKVVEELEKMKVDYKLEDGGTRILVPESVVHEARLKLMGSGASLSGGIGFEIFDESDFGMTEFAQKINFQRALQGELTRTIMSLREVKYARVHLVMPESGLFKRNNMPPSASVTLFLQYGQPSNEQIVGIQRLVAAAVPGLKASQVTVTDQSGLTLSRQVAENEALETVSARLEQKKAVEKYLSDKAMQVLHKAFGSAEVLVSVDVTLDFDQVTTTKESVLPASDVAGNGIVRRRESKFGGGSQQKNAEGNVTTEVEYQLGRSVAQIEGSPGKVLRLSIGVLVPNTVSEHEREKIGELVSMAVGLDASRGDAISIYPLDPVISKVQTGTEYGGVSRDTGEVVAAGSELYVNGQTEEFTDRTWKFIQENLVMSGMALALILFGLFILINSALSGTRNQQYSTGLSTQERDQILLKLNQWLELDGDGGERNEVSRS